jgi:hypothetical protein
MPPRASASEPQRQLLVGLIPVLLDEIPDVLGHLLARAIAPGLNFLGDNS